MTEVKIIGDKIESFIENGVMTISGENINIVETDENKEPSRELSKWFKEVDACVKKCQNCSCSKISELIEELRIVRQYRFPKHD